MLKILKNFKKKDWINSLIVMLVVIVQVWLELKIPDYMSNITRLVQTQGSKIEDILINGGFMILCAFGSLIVAVIARYFSSKVAANFSKNIREKLFKKVEELSISEIKMFSTSSLITRTTNDVTQIQNLIAMGLQLIIRAPLTAVWAIIKILGKSWQWSSVTAIAVVVLLSTLGMLAIIVIPKFKIIQKLIDKINGISRENLTGIRVIRAFNAEKFSEDKFEEANTKLTNQLLFNQRMFSIMEPMMYLIMHFVALAIYFVGANLIKDATFGDKIGLFGDMVVFSSYAIQVIISFLMLAIIFMQIPRAGVSANRINEVLDTKITVIDGKLKDIENDEKGTVEFKNVSFKYPDAEEYILKDISFKVNKGETVAFIGSTGSGKSTLINLIPRFYDVTDGEILVDGVNVKEYSLEYLYNKLGYVSQKAVLFNGTVSSNVSFGDNGDKKPDEDIIKEAIRVAQATEFVEKMDNKYDSYISAGGKNISGGQKQRLSIARAIARNPEIYIFDDSFSALDYKTDSALRKELKKYTNGATNLIVAQRIGTILNSDKIIVLDEGKMVGIGTHKELLKNCEVYKQIALSQLSENELK